MKGLLLLAFDKQILQKKIIYNTSLVNKKYDLYFTLIN